MIARLKLARPGLAWQRSDGWLTRWQAQESFRALRNLELPTTQLT